MLFRSRPREDHPLNSIIERLLSWFSAYYALDAEQTRPADADASHQDMQSSIVPSESLKWQKLKQLRASMQLKRGRSTESPIAEARPLRTAEGLAKLAMNLESHAGFMRLLEEAFQVGWPTIDKGPDKKPNNGHVPPQPQVFSDSALSGSKRRIMDYEADDQQGSRKRRRT